MRPEAPAPGPAPISHPGTCPLSPALSLPGLPQARAGGRPPGKSRAQTLPPHSYRQVCSGRSQPPRALMGTARHRTSRVSATRSGTSPSRPPALSGSPAPSSPWGYTVPRNPEHTHTPRHKRALSHTALPSLLDPVPPPQPLSSLHWSSALGQSGIPLANLLLSLANYSKYFRRAHTLQGWGALRPH